MEQPEAHTYDGQNELVSANERKDTELSKTKLYGVHVNFEPTTSNFLNACLDSGAQCTITGRRHLKVYVQQVGEDKSSSRNVWGIAKRFKFGNMKHPCQGILHLRMPIADNKVVIFDASVVPSDVSLLIGLDVLRSLKLSFNFSAGTLINNINDWKVKFVFKLGHLY